MEAHAVTSIEDEFRALQELISWSASEGSQELITLVDRLAADVSNDGQMYLLKFADMQETNSNTLQRVLVSLSIAKQQRDSIGAFVSLSADDERSIEALEIPATSIKRDTPVNALLCTWLMATVILVNRLGWAGVVYAFLGLALVLVIVNFWTTSDFKENVRPPLVSLMLRRGLDQLAIASHIESTQTPCPNLKNHVHEIYGDPVLGVFSILARWGIEEDEEEV